MSVSGVTNLLSATPVNSWPPALPSRCAGLGLSRRPTPCGRPLRPSGGSLAPLDDGTAHAIMPATWADRWGLP